MTDAMLLHALQFMLVGWTVGNALWSGGLWLWHLSLRVDREKGARQSEWLMQKWQEIMPPLPKQEAREVEVKHE